MDGRAGWYDLRNYRLDPALGGFDIHWSRLPDLPIAGLIVILKPFLGVRAENWACGIAPLLPLAVTMTGLSLTVRRLIAPYSWPLALRRADGLHLDHDDVCADAHRSSRLAARLRSR
jgi:hypothetical protein